MAKTTETWLFNYIVGILVDSYCSARFIWYSFIHYSATTVAASGSTQGDAAAMSGGRLHYLTSDSATKGWVLTSSAVISGLIMEAIVTSATGGKIYPASGHKIIKQDGTDLGANNPLTVAGYTSTRFVSDGATTMRQIVYS